MLITYTNYLCVVCVCVCVCPGEGNVAFNATPNPFHLNKICLNQLYVYHRGIGFLILTITWVDRMCVHDACWRRCETMYTCVLSAINLPWRNSWINNQQKNIT